MMYQFSERSYNSMTGVDPKLIAVATLALSITDIDFIVTEGLRTEARQRALVASGASRTMRSRHLTGQAIDVAASVNGDIRWDWPLYSQIAQAFKTAADSLGIEIIWGGDWETFRDGPHFQLKHGN